MIALAPAFEERRLPRPHLVPRSAETVAVVGGGNCAHALSAHLARRGHPVHLLVRSLERLPGPARTGAIPALGHVEGRFSLASVGERPGPALGEASTVFVATVATAYPDVARMLAPALRPGHRVVLFSGKLAGCVEFERALLDLGIRGVLVCETDALFASRVQDDGSIWVRGIKRWNLVTAPRRSQTDEALDLLRTFFEGLEPARNVIQRGLTDFGALAHPMTMLANMNSVDRAEHFLFYCDGFTERTVVLLERLEEEFRRVAEAYGSTLLPAAEWLDRYYGCDRGGLLEAMRSVPNYRTSVAPKGLDHRYLQEDVSCTLVLLRELARVAGVETPLADAVVTMASALTGRDFAREGRTLQRLGWGSLSHRGILARIEG